MPLALFRTGCSCIKQAPFGVRRRPTLAGTLLIDARYRCNRLFHGQFTHFSDPMRASSDKPIVLSGNLELPAQHD
jgi:hypothetical protein